MRRASEGFLRCDRRGVTGWRNHQPVTDSYYARQRYLLRTPTAPC
jgi:hypothetical protein